MNGHCKSCLRLHAEKQTAGFLTLVNFALSIRVSMDTESSSVLAMLAVQAMSCWLLFGIVVTTVNRALRCHTEKGALTWTQNT